MAVSLPGQLDFHALFAFADSDSVWFVGDLGRDSLRNDFWAHHSSGCWDGHRGRRCRAPRIPQPQFVNELFVQGPFWLLAKIFVFLFVYVWMRGTLPRFRYDKLMSFGWKLLLPVSIANVVITAFVMLLRGAK